MRILLIDDDPFFAQQLQRSLGRREYVASLADNPTDALNLAREYAFDAAIVDLKLGGESGLQLIAPLRALQRTMRIVLLTGYASVATAVEAIKRGADDYLPKPVRMDALLRALHDDTGDLDEPPVPKELTPLSRLEWEHIQQALHESGGSVSGAARMLGMHRRSLQRKLQKRPG